jgi:hypothetical protein
MPVDEGLQLPANCLSVLSAKKTSIDSSDKRNNKVIALNSLCPDAFLRPKKRVARGGHSIRHKADSACKTGVTVRRIGGSATLADSLIPRHGDSGSVGERKELTAGEITCGYRDLSAA